MDDLQVSRFDTFLRKLLSIKRGGLLRAIDPRVQLGLNPFDQPEFAYLMGTRTWTVMQSVTGAVGVAAAIGIHNPPGSGVMCVIERIITGYNVGPTGVLDHWIVNADFSTLAGFTSNPLQQTDSRLLLASSPASSIICKVQTANSVGFVGTVNSFLGNSGGWSQASEVPGKIVVMPGFTFAVRNAVANASIGLFASGYERPFEASER